MNGHHPCAQPLAFKDRLPLAGITPVLQNSGGT